LRRRDRAVDVRRGRAWERADRRAVGRARALEGLGRRHEARLAAQEGRAGWCSSRGFDGRREARTQGAPIAGEAGRRAKGGVAAFSAAARHSYCPARPSLLLGGVSVREAARMRATPVAGGAAVLRLLGDVLAFAAVGAVAALDDHGDVRVVLV